MAQFDSTRLPGPDRYMVQQKLSEAGRWIGSILDHATIEQALSSNTCKMAEKRGRQWCIVNSWGAVIMSGEGKTIPIALQIDPALPCSTFDPVTRQKCGKPAKAAYGTPTEGQTGGWAIFPVCEGCVKRMMLLYGFNTTDPAPGAG